MTDSMMANNWRPIIETHYLVLLKAVFDITGGDPGWFVRSEWADRYMRDRNEDEQQGH